MTQCDIHTQIAAVLQDHSPLDNWTECGCGKWRAWTADGPNGCHEEHVAEVLVRELGLTPEWGNGDKDESKPRMLWGTDCEDEVREWCTSHNSTPFTRYVTAWTPEGTE